jgi:hypothetical protein
MKKSDVKELDKKAAAGEEVVPGGKGGKSLDAQERLAEGLSHFWVPSLFC